MSECYGTVPRSSGGGCPVAASIVGTLRTALLTAQANEFVDAYIAACLQLTSFNKRQRDINILGLAT